MFALTALVFLAASTAAKGPVRPPAVAGSFYPADHDELQQIVDAHLDAVPDTIEIDGEIIALVVPHAGLVYSGHIAAHAYKLLDGAAVNRVVLVGPSHRHPFSGSSVYGPGVTWKTPLGPVPCDREWCDLMLDRAGQFQIAEAHAQEHCLEVQLPYLQSVLQSFTIVPICMGFPDPATLRATASALATLPWDRHSVLVASTDWQHYRSSAEGWPMDSLGMVCLQSFDPDRLERLLGLGEVQACGGQATVAVMKAAAELGADRVRLLRYGDSGDITGDRSSVVGYVAAVIYKSDSPVEETSATSPSSSEPYSLTDDEKRTLLALARRSIEEYLETGGRIDLDVSGRLQDPGAAFVTLEREGRLRGCIGHTQAVQPLAATVAECAISAATQDPRFMPIGRDELESLHLEISVLTPLQPVAEIDEIEVGRDGLMIVLGRNRGLLLPQVATNFGWDRDEFLGQTCRKAGLAPDAYTDPRAALYRFQALVFSE